MAAILTSPDAYNKHTRRQPVQPVMYPQQPARVGAYSPVMPPSAYFQSATPPLSPYYASQPYSHSQAPSYPTSTAYPAVYPRYAEYTRHVQTSTPSSAQPQSQYDGFRNEHRRQQRARKQPSYGQDKRKSEVCASYGSAIGCKWGDSCFHAHSDPNSVSFCKLFASPKGCQYGDKCYDRHKDWNAVNDASGRHARRARRAPHQAEVAEDHAAEEKKVETVVVVAAKEEKGDEKAEDESVDAKPTVDVFTKIDSGLAAYYAICRRSDYVNADGKGKFMHFVETHKLRFTYALTHICFCTCACTAKRTLRWISATQRSPTTVCSSTWTTTFR